MNIVKYQAQWGYFLCIIQVFINMVTNDYDFYHSDTFWPPALYIYWRDIPILGLCTYLYRLIYRLLYADNVHTYVCLWFCTLCRYHAHDDDHLGLDFHYSSNAPSPYLTPRNKSLKGLCKEHNYNNLQKPQNFSLT